MKPEDTPSQGPQDGTPRKGFLAGLFTRIDQAMKSAAEKKARQSCCSPDGGKSGSGKGGKCC